MRPGAKTGLRADRNWPLVELPAWQFNAGWNAYLFGACVTRHELMHGLTGANAAIQ